MASLIPSGSASGTGSMTLAAPVTNSNQTATLPDATGTVLVSGNMPAYSAYLNFSQSLSSGVTTKIAMNAKNFDTANAYDNNTNYRFQPLVAGYYQISANAQLGASTAAIGLYIYKTGNPVAIGSAVPVSGILNASASVSCLIYLNGSSDYVEIYAYQGSGTSYALVSSGFSTTVSGVLVRSA